MGRGLHAPKFCEETGCEERVSGHGLCKRHYMKFYRRMTKLQNISDSRNPMNPDDMWLWVKDTLGIQGGNTRKIRF